MTTNAPITDALSLITPPLRVDGFNAVVAGEQNFTAMIVRDDDPGCASILAQNMTDDMAHAFVTVINHAAAAVAEERAQIVELANAYLAGRPPAVDVFLTKLWELCGHPARLTKSGQREIRDAKNEATRAARFRSEHYGDPMKGSDHG